MPREKFVSRFAQMGLALVLTVSMLGVTCKGQTAAVGENQRRKAFALEQQGDATEAERAWRGILKVHPADAEAYAHLGFLEARQEHYTTAVPLYRKALEINPTMPDLRLNYGLSLFKSGALKEAVQTFTPLLRTLPPASPETIRVTTLIGLAHYGSGEYAAAVPFLMKATAADPQNLPFRLALAHSCLWSKQFQCVLDVYHQILMLNAESAEADMLAGEAYDEMKNDAGATQEFQAAAKADPKMPDVHFGYGYLLWRLMKYEEAAQEFKAELANNPQHAEAMTYLADTEIRMSEPDAALPLLEKAIRIRPTIALAHLDLGMLYVDKGRKEDALRELKEAVKLSPTDQNAHWRLARFYQSTGRKLEAKAEFDKTRSLQKASDETIFTKLKKAQEKGPPENSAPSSPAN
jgi:Tfp pilus assembly protein PilF